MLAYRLSIWICDRFFSGHCTRIHDSMLEAPSEWEFAYSLDWEPWVDASDEIRELLEQGNAIRDADMEAAFRLWLQAADAGSIQAMVAVGQCYDYGAGAEKDFGLAQEYYYRALCAGSWRATIDYAWLLERHGHLEHAEHVLADGVRAEFIPAFFRLASFRYRHSKSRKTRREIRPLLERAAEAGHPGAELMLARLMAQGKFGFRERRRGFGQIRRIVRRFSAEQDAKDSSGPGGTPAPATAAG